jgi:hypothetical protein
VPPALSRSPPAPSPPPAAQPGAARGLKAEAVRPASALLSGRARGEEPAGSAAPESRTPTAPNRRHGRVRRPPAPAAPAHPPGPAPPGAPRWRAEEPCIADRCGPPRAPRLECGSCRRPARAQTASGPRAENREQRGAPPAGVIAVAPVPAAQISPWAGPFRTQAAAEPPSLPGEARSPAQGSPRGEKALNGPAAGAAGVRAEVRAMDRDAASVRTPGAGATWPTVHSAQPRASLAKTEPVAGAVAAAPGTRPGTGAGLMRCPGPAREQIVARRVPRGRPTATSGGGTATVREAASGSAPVEPGAARAPGGRAAAGSPAAFGTSPSRKRSRPSQRAAART